MPPRRRNSSHRPQPSLRAVDPTRISALPQALDLALAPTLAASLQRRPLPHDVLTLIRLAAGCRETLAAAVAATGRPPDIILASAEFYLRQVVCFPGADPHRILAVPPHAPRAQMRHHMRELMLWLQRDQGRGDWNAILARRVIAAWQAVGDAAPARPPRRVRHIPTYRPSWIARPLAEARPAGARRRLWGLLRLTLVMAGLVLPAVVTLGPCNLAAGLLHLSDEARWIRTGGDAASPAGPGCPAS